MAMAADNDTKIKDRYTHTVKCALQATASVALRTLKLRHDCSSDGDGHLRRGRRTVPLMVETVDATPQALHRKEALIESSCHTVSHAASRVMRGVLQASGEPTLPKMGSRDCEKRPL